MSTLYHDSIPKAPGIYRITCTTTGKFYIGSSINLSNRWRQHQQELQRNTHPNKKLQHAWNKHTETAFIFEVLELILLPEMLTIREQYYFETLKPFGKRGFNLAPTAGSNLGIKASPETREKLRKSHLGQPGYWTGKKRDPETTAKANAKKRGKDSPRYPGYTHTPEHREKLRIANLGKKASEETKHKLTEMRKGRKQSPEAIEKTRLANLGRKNSPEAITRMIDARTREMKTVIMVDPNGTERVVIGIRQFCQEYGLDRRAIQRVVNGVFKQHKGWTLRTLETDRS